MKAWLRSLLQRPTSPAANTATRFIYVYLPEALEPDERHARYENALDAELRLVGAGYVSGGGTLCGPEDEDGERETLHVGVDVDAYDLNAARAVLRDHLPDLGCRPGTRLEYEDGGEGLGDSWDGTTWTERQPLSPNEDRDDDS